MKRSHLLVIATLILSACNSSPEPSAQAQQHSVAPTYGAYMLVMGKNYEAKDLGAYAQALPSIYAKYGGTYVSFATDVDVAEGTYDYQSLIISGCHPKQRRVNFGTLLNTPKPKNFETVSENLMSSLFLRLAPKYESRFQIKRPEPNGSGL